MKQKLLNLKSWLFMMCLLVGVGSAWAEDATIASFSNSSNTGWTISGSPSYSNTGGYQLVASTMSITSPTITFSNYSNITITIKCRKYGGPNSTQGKISVSQGNTELATYSPTGTSLANSSALSIAPSDGKLVFSCPGASSSKGCGISEIVIKGTPKDDIPEPTPVDASWTVSPTSVSVEAGKQASVTITTDYDGELSVSSNASSIATASISGNTITVNGVAEGTATLTISGSATTNYNAISKTVDVTVTAAQGGEDNEDVLTAKKESFDKLNAYLDSNIYFNCYQGGAGTAPGNYNGGIRLYQISSTNKYGGYIEISAKQGYKINSVKVTSTKTYATTINYSVDGGNFVLETNHPLAKSSSYEITSLNNSKVTIYNTGTGSDGRLEIAALEVKYVAVPEATEFKYTLDIVGEGTVKFVDGENNELNEGDDIAKDTEITPIFAPGTGYEFTSWEYFSTSANEWKLIENNTFTITKDVDFRVTFSKIKQKNAVIIVAPENGTLTIKDGESVINNGDLVEEGTTLTVVVEANDGYRFKNWGYKDGDANWVGNMTANFTHVMPAAPCQFKATFEAIPTYTISWSVNGNIEKSETVYEGTTVSAPAVDESNGKVFVGWATISFVDSETGNLVIPSATATADATYYAVFATAEEGTGETTVELDNRTIKDSYVPASGSDNGTTSYGERSIGDWNGKFLINLQDNKYFVQINKDGRYIASPTYEQVVSKVTINTTGGTNTSTKTASGRKFFLCADATDANPTSGAYGSGAISEDNGSVTIETTGAPKQFYLFTDGTARIASIVVTCGSPTSYSDFTTLLSADVTISKYGYATYVAPCVLDFTDTDVEAYSVTPDLANNEVKLTAVTTVPAGKAIVVKGKQGTHTIPATKSATDFDTALKASATEVIATDADTDTYYYLGVVNEEPVFRPLAVGGKLAVGKCFFTVAKSAGAKNLKMAIIDDETTGISNVRVNTVQSNAIYNLAGQRVNANAKGIIIVNGKKLLNK